MKRHFASAVCSVAVVVPFTAPAEMVDLGADLNALPTAPPEFEVTTFAREPLVRQPCSLAFDAKGRLFVGMGPQYRNPTPETPGDSVVIVSDEDGDGTADKTHVFATGLNTIQGLAWHGRDLWIANSPDLTVVRDRDGDDVADEYIKVYTDLGNLEHGLHGLVWAPDGRLYMSKGNSKGLNDPKQPRRLAPQPFRELFGQSAAPGPAEMPEPQSYTAQSYQHTYQDPKDDWGLMGGVLRCDDMGANLEIVARGLRNPWDIAMDDAFNWLGTDNDQNDGDRVFMPFYGAHFGWNHPWSSSWTGQGNLPTTPVSHPVFHGSGTGIIYENQPHFPEKYRGAFLVNDWLRKTTFLFKPKWNGALMNCEGGEWTPFIIGGNALFRPTDIALGPDGALWCLSWSRGYGSEFKEGEMTNEGRIYRIAVRGAKVPALSTKPMAERSTQELIAAFNSPLPVHRIDAQDELAHRGKSVRDELLKAMNDTKLTEAEQTWATWALARISPVSIIEDGPMPESNTNIQMLRTFARNPDGFISPDALVSTAKLDSPRMRFEAVQCIWQTHNARLVPLLVSLAAVESDRLTYYSTWRALRDLTSTDDLKSLLADKRPGVCRAAVLGLLEDGALTKDEVKKLCDDPDRELAALATSWIANSTGNAAQPLVKGNGIVPANVAPITGTPPEIKPPAQPTTLEAALAAMPSADPKRGRLLVLHPAGAGCIACHNIGGRGNHFGPDLTGIGSRVELKHLVQSMIEPSAVITEGFNSHVVITAQGAQSGVLLNESGMAITLGLPTGQVARVLRADIKKHETLPVSAMPPFGVLLTAQQCADIAAWLMTQEDATAQEAGKKDKDKDGDKEKKDKKKEKEGVAATAAAQPTGKAEGEGESKIKSKSKNEGEGAQRELVISKEPLSFTRQADRITLLQGQEKIGEFVFANAQVKRPFFANMRAPGGIPVTRTFPPVDGVDPTDHADMHPGIWLAFGDINGEDFWRNKATMRHDKFTKAPVLEAEQGMQGPAIKFATTSTLLTAQGEPMGQLDSEFSIGTSDGVLAVLWHATFRATVRDLVFGDQEEMGFGVRVATPLTEKNGGLITSSAGLTTAKKTWGQPAEWCDYSGVIAGRAAGISIVPQPGNPQPCWWHNRDYGVFVANAFGRRAMKQGDKQSITVKQGSSLELGFAALLHAGDSPLMKKVREAR